MSQGGGVPGVGRVDHKHGLPPGIAKKIKPKEDGNAQGQNGQGITINININAGDRAGVSGLAQNVNNNPAAASGLDALNNLQRSPRPGVGFNALESQTPF